MFNWMWMNKPTCVSGCKGYALLDESLERERRLLMRLNHTMDLLNTSDQKVYEYEAIWKLRQEKERDEKLKNDKTVADLLDGAGMKKVGEFIVPKSASIPSLLDGADYMNYKKTKGDMRDNMYKGPLTPVPVSLPKKPGRKPKVKAS